MLEKGQENRRTERTGPSTKEVLVVFGKKEFVRIIGIVTQLQCIEEWIGVKEVDRGSSFASGLKGQQGRKIKVLGRG